MGKKIEVDKDILLALKVGIINAIASEDGLDGSDGVLLLTQLNFLLGLPLFDYETTTANCSSIKHSAQRTPTS